MDAKRAAQYGIAHRTPGTLHAFPLRRFKAREQGQQKAEPYHILAIIASSANYPTGLITINGLALGRISIGATELWTKLGIQESDQKNAPFLKPGALELELANTRIAGLRKSYNIENISPNDAQGYKIPLRGL
jgi:hypothetical protein